MNIGLRKYLDSAVRWLLNCYIPEETYQNITSKTRTIVTAAKEPAVPVHKILCVIKMAEGGSVGGSVGGLTNTSDGVSPRLSGTVPTN
mmetsp:Transcript_59792/g.146835  ORF Transcript_59792/g.146835 Transcript_59792/m.146835 type:complete len:88 (+) Transcript_59792:937-1200(+)